MLCLSRCLLIQFLIVVVLLSNAFAASKKRSPVEWTEVKSWQNLGPLWAGGLDEKGNLLAIYDLSFPTLLDRVNLGLLDTSVENYNRSIEILKSANDGNAKDSTGQSSQDDPNTVAEAIDSLENLRKSSTQLRFNSSESILPSHWWKDVPWKTSVNALRAKAPQRFLLSDIDYLSIAKDKKQFEQELKKFGNNFLDQFEFVKAKNGGFLIYWSPAPTRATPPAVTKPVKLVDLRCIKCGLYESLGTEALKDALDVILMLIPDPLVSGLLGTAITEYFMFQKELSLSHQEMALEMIRSADEQSTPSPFKSLSAPSREQSASFLLFAESTLFSAWKWTTKTPKEEWILQENQALQQAADSEKFLVQRGETLSPLNPRFLIGLDPQNNKRIYLSAAPRYWNIMPPFVAVDYSNPERILYERISVETAHILISFLKKFIPVPLAGTVLEQAYNILIEGPMHTVQHWESRLSAHLTIRDTAGENWNPELNVLQLQKINPMEIAPKEAQDLADSRRRACGIP